jgi:hypothetical protein
MDPEINRRNVRLGLILGAVAVLIVVATVVTAFVYNAAN